MSFVQRLRMANMFPIQSDLGDARINPGTDNYDEIIQNALANQMSRGNNIQRPNGLSQVANAGRNMPSNQPMNVVQGQQSNPGADILNRSVRDTNQIYDSYKEPQLTAGEVLKKAGLKQNDQNLPGNTDNIDLELNRNVKRSLIEQRTNPNSKVINITDPEDRTKQISVNYDPKNRTITPITMGNDNTVQPGIQAKANLTEIDKNKKEAETEDILKNHAKEALAILDRLSKSTGKVDENGYSIEELNPNTQTVTGRTAHIPSMLTDLWDPKNATARADIDQLSSMLSLNKMQELKAQSKSGSTGFGSNMNQKEFGTLVSAASTLKQMSQDEPGYAQQLGKVRTLMQKVANGTAPDMSSKTNNKIESTNIPKAPDGYEYVRRPDNKGWTAIKKVGK